MEAIVRSRRTDKHYGIWGDDGMSDDEFVKELKSLRSFNREIIEL